MQGNNPGDAGRWWTVQRGGGPVVATAIHDGHELRPEVARLMRISEDERLREEDPFTGHAILDVPTHIIAHRSRFEFDLNRGPEEAVYQTREQSWGLDVWKEPPPADLVKRSLALHAAYYAMLGHVLQAIADSHERFVLIDPPQGNMRNYLQSLERMRSLPGLTVLLGGHGPAVATPYQKIDEYISHRLEREQNILAAVRAGATTPKEIVERVYTDVSPKAYGMAERAVLAHLEKLHDEGRI